MHTIFLIALVAVAMWAPQVGAAQVGPTLRVEPERLDVRPNARFQVQVTIEDAENLGGFQVELAYDPAVLQVQDVTLGDFLVGTGRTELPVGPDIDNQEGTAAFGAASFGEAAGADGSGVLATVSGRAQGEGSSTLTLQRVQVLDTAAGTQEAQTEDGLVVVGATGGQQSAPGLSLRWGLIGGAALLAVVGAVALILGVRGRRSDEAAGS